MLPQVTIRLGTVDALYLGSQHVSKMCTAFFAEAGQPKERLQRDFVAQQLNLPALRCNAMERVGTDMYVFAKVLYH
eukprot:3772648-Pleurochrysis_carterae.AAC.4